MFKRKTSSADSTMKRKGSDTNLPRKKEKEKLSTKRSKSVADVSSAGKDSIKQDVDVRTSSDSLKSIKKRGGNKYLSKVKRLNAEQLLVANPLALFTVLKSAIEDEEMVGIALGTFFLSRPEVLRLAVYCIGEEMRVTNDSALILRGSGVNTRVLSTLINLSGRAFLKRVLAPVVQTIIRENKGIEIDPSRISPNEDVKTNLQNLIRTSDLVIDAINSNLAHLPGTIAVIARELHDLVAAKFEGSQFAAVGGLVVLRFIVPALTMPENFELVKECSRDLRRKLIIVGKLLQAVYNGVLEQKEEWMQPLAAYVEESKNASRVLASQLLNIAGELNPKQFMKTLKELTPNRDEMKNARSVLRNFCISNLEKLQASIVRLKEDEECKDNQLRVMLTAVERELTAMKLPAQDLVAEVKVFLGQFWTWTLQQSEKKTTLEDTNEAFVTMVNMFDFEGATTVNDDYTVCILRVTDDSGTVKMIEMPREALTVEQVAKRVKQEFSKIDRVVYEKDGNKMTLVKSSFPDFEGSAVVRGNRAVYKLHLTRKTSALNSYMNKI
mmetsp:Transcript_17518/g.67963  ORF Transcript_17518/g.67963 Transcript_17518/m.67963 type:complete len:553 (-) Transcript_17518:135-1793(-)|eukprot:CAMPEP_0114624706 /NCGR_PEP_ID=MMETSP0168-20121206/10901_1 /TAXON_ID=95228 ORGANISM="Vannella sp., Strain DIVA3 517/6/12" /NCGR_SAMPLE_ID=MMETSP0168 /ASSEMBLY_ACC=CAM_ASM_000044 /LENGTH=552 /DNA_ID=CAMNT_0001835981 /DNA_START=213 /DNA_END=1871 /DNA_ORIENTATION=-